MPPPQACARGWSPIGTGIFLPLKRHTIAKGGGRITKRFAFCALPFNYVLVMGGRRIAMQNDDGALG